MKISDFGVGDLVQGRLVVADATLGKTKGNPPKPYVRLTLTDGSEQVQSMLWDWDEGTSLPAKGLVLDINAKCTAYQGKKQLSNISYMPAEDQSITEFQPHYTEDAEGLFDAAMELIQGFSNSALRELLTYIYQENTEAILNATSAAGIHHVGIGGNLAHSLEVAHICQAIANLFPADINYDLVIAGALVHDLGKCLTYKMDGPVIEYTRAGELFDHSVLGLEFLNEADCSFNYRYHPVVDLLKHICLSHHGSKEFGAPATPRFIEAYIVSYADGISATLDTMRQANKKAMAEGKEFTDKVFTCNNTRHLLQADIRNMLKDTCIDDSEPF